MGVYIMGNRLTTMGVLLPIFSSASAVALTRFDFFIHRHASYLRTLKGDVGANGVDFSLWESWRTILKSTTIVVTVLNVLVSLAIIVPTLGLIFGPAREYFCHAWQFLIRVDLHETVVSLLGCLGAMPAISGR
jgi:hypothetical protein